MDCIFCKIINKQTAADIIYEDEKFTVFKDIKPKAPVHFLVVPRKHIISIDHVEIEDKELIGELILVAQKVAREENLKGYRLLVNIGREGGQVIDHLHFHLLAGFDWKTKELP